MLELLLAPARGWQWLANARKSMKNMVALTGIEGPGIEAEMGNAGKIGKHYRSEFQFRDFDPIRHNVFLRESSGVLLVWGEAEQEWFDPKRNESRLLKTTGFRYT